MRSNITGVNMAVGKRDTFKWIGFIVLSGLYNNTVKTSSIYSKKSKNSGFKHRTHTEVKN